MSNWLKQDRYEAALVQYLGCLVTQYDGNLKDQNLDEICTISDHPTDTGLLTIVTVVAGFSLP